MNLLLESTNRSVHTLLIPRLGISGMIGRWSGFKNPLFLKETDPFERARKSAITRLERSGLVTSPISKDHADESFRITHNNHTIAMLWARSFGVLAIEHPEWKVEIDDGCFSLISHEESILTADPRIVTAVNEALLGPFIPIIQNSSTNLLNNSL